MRWPITGLPYPIRCSGDTVEQIVCLACRSESFAGSTLRRAVLRPRAWTMLRFCTDGVFERNDALGREFGVERLLNVVTGPTKTAREMVDAIFAAVLDFRGDTPANDE